MQMRIGLINIYIVYKDIQCTNVTRLKYIKYIN